jgi:hypothetical protein
MTLLHGADSLRVDFTQLARIEGEGKLAALTRFQEHMLKTLQLESWRKPFIPLCRRCQIKFCHLSTRNPAIVLYLHFGC